MICINDDDNSRTSHKQVIQHNTRKFTLPFENLKDCLSCLDCIAYTGKLCHHGKCHSGNCHSGERWLSRPFVHSGNLNFKHTLTIDLVFQNA